MIAIHSFEEQTADGKYTVGYDSPTIHGWFEHNTLGEDSAGGLWFRCEDGHINLTDYDGVFELPTSVIDTLRSKQLIVAEEFE